MSADAERDLTKLLNTNDEDFVRLAYRFILNRDPDPAGLANYLQQVRSGRDLRHIATEIAHSEEAQKRPAHWRTLLSLDQISAGSKSKRWLRRRLFGTELAEMRQGVRRLENQVFRLGKTLETRTTGPAKLKPLPRVGPAAQHGLVSDRSRTGGPAANVSSALLGLGGPRPNNGMWPRAMRRTIHVSAVSAASGVLPPRGLRVLLDGHISGSYSLAITNRELVQAMLRHGADIDVAVQPRDVDLTDEIKDLPSSQESYELFQSLLARGKEAAFTATPYVRLYHAWPPVAHKRRANEIAIGIFFWEESIIPGDIVRLFNKGYDGLIVTTWFVKKTLIDNGCLVPIELVPFPHELIGGNLPQVPARRSDRRYIDFLHVSSCFARKGPEALLRAFNEIALRMPNVRLIIKTFDNPHLQIREQIKRCVDQQIVDRIRLIVADFSDEQMAELYRSADAIVLPTRGEGLNMPAIEAAYFGLPVIATGYTGHADFMTDDNAWPVAFDFAPSRSHLEREGSLWCEPRHTDLCSRMSEVALGLMNTPHDTWAHADKLTQVAHDTFLHPRATTAFQLGLQRLAWNSAEGANARPLRICLVTSWMEVCGIAEYSNFLGVALRDSGASISVIAPEGDRTLDSSLLPAVKGAWRQGMYFRMTASEFDADIAWFQHHPAFFLLGDDVRQLVEALAEKGTLSFITLHSTKELMNDISQLPRLAACLRQFERVIVHSAHDCNALQMCGVAHNVVVVPHGVTSESPSNRDALSATSRNVRIGCFGFLLRHKGVDKLIEALALARRGSTDRVFTLRLVTSVRGDDESAETYRRCRELARVLEVEDAIEWHTDFLPNGEVMKLLAACDLLVLPYQPTNESASGAVRQALAACANVLVSTQSIFDELRHCAFTVQANNAENLWGSIGDFLSQLETEAQRERIEARARWLVSRDWGRIAHQSTQLARACLTDHQYATKWLSTNV